MSQQSTPIDDLYLARLRDALRIADPNERDKKARQEFELLLQGLNNTAPPRKKRGKQPPDVDVAVEDILRPMWEAVLDYGDLLLLSRNDFNNLRPGQTFECKSMPIYIPKSDKTVYFQITLTSHALNAVKNWKGVRLRDLVTKVQAAIGKKVGELQEQLKQIPDTRAYQKQRNDIQRQMAKLEDILRRDEARLSRHIGDAVIRYLLSIGVTWHEMPPCLVDNRQKWLGKKDRIQSFYDRQEVLLKYQGSDTVEEFEARDNAFLSSLKDLTN